MSRIGRITQGLAAHLLSLALVLGGAAGAARAQSATRRLVPRGDVTGLEMTIEGTMRGAPGGHVRWIVTTYEVLRRRDLRVASGIQLALTASYAPGEPVMVTTSDAEGHAVLDLTLPDDIESAPNIVVEAVSPRGVRRTFDAMIELLPRRRVQLLVDRSVVPPGGTVVAIGRVLDAETGLPRAGEEVRLSLRDGVLVRAPSLLTTDASGVFASVVSLPERTGSFQLEAATDDASQHVDVRTDVAPTQALWARAVPAQSTVAPGAVVPVDVLVRSEDGSPVRGARVSWSDAPDDEAHLVRTDASGHASLSWEIDRLAAGAGVEDRDRAIRVVHPAYGTGSGSATVRVARAGSVLTFAVEGGALAPGLTGRVYVRATRADGSAHAAAAVRLESDELGATQTQTSDASGVSIFEVTLPTTRASATGECGGPTAVAATLVLDGARTDVCLPVDPDALLALRAHTTAAGIEVSVERRAEAAHDRVVILALGAEADGWLPLARASLDSHTRAATLALPPTGPTPVWVRARVVRDGQEIVGGSTLVLAGQDAAAPVLSADGEGGGIAASAAPRTGVVVAVDARVGDALRAEIDALFGDAVRARAEGRSEAFVAGVLAARVPRDTTAPAVLRDGAIASLTVPDDAVARGLLRDPWRTRARFVRGRIGSLMRAVEHFVDARVPDQIDTVAVEENGHWRFDREMLEAALAESGLGDERAAALDGEPLDIDALTTLDPDFTFDHVARRITRERLFRMLGFLRQLVRERQLDLAWARRGDPTEYPVSLLESDIGWSDEYPQRAHLFDGWGHPFVLVPVRGHARFDRLQPVPGYELVSAGPDGRVGSGDDVFDPFARVLPSGGVYAEAVGEDVLVARLGGVELGRAWVETLGETFSVEATSWYQEAAASVAVSWDHVPAPDTRVTPPLAPLPRVRSALAVLGASGGTTPSGAVVRGAWTPAAEHRAYEAFALAFEPSGALSVRSARFEAGAPYLSLAPIPERLRVGDAVRVPLQLVHLVESGPVPAVEARASGSAVEARVEGGALVLRAAREGVADVTLTLAVPGTPTFSRTEHVRVLPVGALHATHDGALGRDVSITVPRASGRAWRGQVVIGAPPSLRHDPLFAPGGAAHDEAISAWADALAGGAGDPEDHAALERLTGTEPAALHQACALVVWAADDDPRARAPFSHVERVLASALPTGLADRATVLAALAPGAPRIGDPNGVGPLDGVIGTLREDAWRAIATERDHPATMAQMAAALLVADREDAVARALYERARAAASPERGLPDDEEDWVAGSFALLVAARQLGDDAFADALAPHLVGRAYLAPRGGARATFWALAASAYGALGGGAPGRVTVEIDGRSEERTLEGGAITLEVAPGTVVHARADSPVWVRVEGRTLADDATAVRDLPIDVRLDGTVGHVGEHTALELAIESTGDEALGALAVELSLPAGLELDAAALATLVRTPGVSAVRGPDRAGVVRFTLSELRARGVQRIPIALRARSAGTSTGLAVTLYEHARPTARTVLPSRAVVVEEEESP